MSHTSPFQGLHRLGRVASQRPRTVLAAAVAAGLAIAFAAGWAFGAGGQRQRQDARPASHSGSSTPDVSPSTGTSGPTGTATGAVPPSAATPGATTAGGTPVTLPSATVRGVPIARFGCPAATVRVSTAAQLTSALAAAAPGAVIGLADGVYAGTFTAGRSGTAAAPVYLCGGPGAILDGGSVTGGYVLHLDAVAHWRVSGFTVRNGQKGVMLDGVTDVGLQDLTVRQIGDEAVHLRRNSTGNVVRGLHISGTGQRKDKFGEGLYVGTAQSNWCEITSCAPDRSDRNYLLDNTISGTTSENVDIKEGTTGGVLAGNSFNGTGMTAADSWVDVKGDGWLITGNHGVTSTKDGFQTHVILDGWGDANLFSRNVAELRGGTGVGFYLHKQLGNRVTCDNQAPGAAQLSNDSCT